MFQHSPRVIIHKVLKQNFEGVNEQQRNVIKTNLINSKSFKEIYYTKIKNRQEEDLIISKKNLSEKKVI